MQHNLQLNISEFLSHYWQKKPCVIKQGFSNFIDPIDEHDLATLAQEPEIDARIVRNQGENWQLQHGPFDDFQAVCVDQWSLLVQAVDHYIPEINQLLFQFDFIPQWRLDDMMVSFSVPGAGVGPHLDQYDVFIIQGKGKRRWQVADKGEYQTYTPCPDLQQIKGFNATIIDEVLEPGDIIYIPPGYPHNGVALEPCLNYSVGFRAPNQADLYSSFADFLLDNHSQSQRFGDPTRKPQANNLQVQASDIQAIKTLMHEAIDSSAFDHWLCQYLSRPYEKEPFTLAEEDLYQPEEIKQLMLEHIAFLRMGGIKAVYNEFLSSEDEFVFSVDGQTFSLPTNERERVLTFLQNPAWTIEMDKNSINSVIFIQMLTTLVNTGLWYPDESGVTGDDV